MPIGLVDNTDFQKELDKLSSSKSRSAPVHKEVDGTNHPPPPPVTGTIVESPKKGRQAGDIAVPNAIRQIIGETHAIDGRQEALALAKDFGISPSSVSAYAKGATSTASYDTPVPSIIQHINKSRQRAVKRASTTLNKALSAITQDKLDYSDAKDLSGIAKDMAVIIKHLEPPSETPVEAGKTTPQFVIFAPQFRDERSFEVINVTE